MLVPTSVPASELLVDSVLIIFLFYDTATTEIYTLSLHDALPICSSGAPGCPRTGGTARAGAAHAGGRGAAARDRKSTRLNSSHSQISYAVFCLKKKKTKRSLSPHPSRF